MDQVEAIVYICSSLKYGPHWENTSSMRV